MVFLVNEAMINIGIGTACLVALMGYLVVFVGLVLLMIVVMAVGKVMVANRKKKEKAVSQVTTAETENRPAAPVRAAVPAPGSAGKLMLHDVNPRDAALIMAIVADKMGKPLNELRFKSIKEVK